MANRNRHIGSSLDDLFEETGDLTELNVLSIKRVIAWEITNKMEAEHISKSKMAALMDTSRSNLDGLLDPNNTSVILLTLGNAARVVGKTLRIELV